MATNQNDVLRLLAMMVEEQRAQTRATKALCSVVTLIGLLVAVPFALAMAMSGFRLIFGG